jgi:hypothetical protein
MDGQAASGERETRATRATRDSSATDLDVLVERERARVAPVGGRELRVGAVAQQQPRDLGALAVRGDMQRRAANRVDRVRVDARRREQQRDLPRRTGGGGESRHVCDTCVTPRPAGAAARRGRTHTTDAISPPPPPPSCAAARAAVAPSRRRAP